MRIPKAGITGENWLAYKPYDRLSRYDQHYLAIADTLLQRIREYWTFAEVLKLEPNDLKDLAIIWASYLEDLANDIGLWSAFSERCQAEFGYPVPLYPLDDHYTPGAVNWQDLAFIAWHYVSAVSNNVIAPDMPFLQDLSQEVAPWLADQLRQAPTTDFYEEYLIIDPEDEDDFFYLRDKLEWIGTRSYLTLPTAREDLAREMKDAIEKIGPENVRPEFLAYLTHMNKTRMATSDCTSWAGLSAPQWLAELVDASGEYLDLLTEPLPRIESFFRYLGEDEQHYQWLELTRQQMLSVVRESVDLAPEAELAEGAMHTSLVLWKGEWWLSGSLTYYPDATSLPTTATSNTAYWLLTPKERATALNAIADFEKAFLEVMGGRVACFDSLQEAETQLSETVKYFQSMQSQSSEENKSLSESMEGVLSPQVLDNRGRLALTFIHGEGIRINQMIPGLIDLMQKEQLTGKEDKDRFRYLMTGYLHPDQVTYLLQAYPQKELRVPVPGSKLDLLPYALFLAYYASPAAYEPLIPEMGYQTEGS